MQQIFTLVPRINPSLGFVTAQEIWLGRLPAPSNYTAFLALRQVKVNKSSSPNPTPNRIWSEFAVELVPVVRDIYNTSILQGYIPSQLKETVVVPIPVPQSLSRMILNQLH